MVDDFIPNQFAFLPGDEQYPDVFCKEFLESKELDRTILKNAVPYGSKTKNRALIVQDILKVLGDPEAAKGPVESSLLQGLVQKHRHFFAIRSGAYDGIPGQMPDAVTLLRERGSLDWHGPIWTKEEGGPGGTEVDVPYFVHPTFVNHKAGDNPRRVVRWLLVARVLENGVCFFWDGFSHADTQGPSAGQRRPFKYWEHVDLLIEKLREALGAGWKTHDWIKTVLHHMRPYYREDHEYEWKDLTIRAYAQGVSVHASTKARRIATNNEGRPRDIDLSGLLTLSERLAQAGLSAVGASMTLATRRTAADAILTTMIREWGPIAYHFRLEVSEGGETLCRLFCHFGTGRDGTEDSLQHAGSYQREGGSHFCAEFFLEELIEANELVDV